MSCEEFVLEVTEPILGYKLPPCYLELQLTRTPCTPSPQPHPKNVVVNVKGLPSRL